MGMVVAAHPLAAEAGLSILRHNGNAADAAIATQLALAVVYPRAGNLGGGGFLVYREADGKVHSLDYREVAPAAADRDMFLDSAGQVVTGLSTKGILAAAVPGTVAGLEATFRKLGSGQVSWEALFKPAIDLAESGFHITAEEAERLNKYRDDFAAFNPPDMPFLKATPWVTGDLLVQKRLASTLRKIASEFCKGFYEGTIAEAIVETSETHNGILTLNDLESYRPIWRTPCHIYHGEYRLYTMGLPSSGGVIIGQVLQMIGDKLDPEKGFRHPDNVHLITEAERRAFADRAHFLGDTAFNTINLNILLSPEYLLEKWMDFDPEKATSSQTIGINPYTLTLEKFETTHISIVDRNGCAASVTTTLNDNYGCKVWVPNGGFFLNNEMDDFTIKPGAPNFYGLVGSEANAIAPGKRMLSSMTPTIIEKRGKLYMVLGTPGGPTITTSILQVFLNNTVFGMDIHDAVQSSRYHHQWFPDHIQCEENAFSPKLVEALSTKGHNITWVKSLGTIEAIYIDSTGTMVGAADRRRMDDHVAAW